MFKKMLFVLVLLLLAVPLVSYAQDDQEETTILWIGTVTDAPDEFVGLAIDGDTATLYICDGRPEDGTVSIAEWFMGTVTDKAFDVTTAKGNRVEVTLGDDTATGHFTFKDGTTKEFTLALADGDAALYRSEFAFGEDEFIGGWLVLSDGSIRGAVLKKGSVELVPASLNFTLPSKKESVQDGTSNTVQ
jgi:hypothetical protein